MQKKRIFATVAICMLIVGVCIPTYARTKGEIRSDDVDITIYGGVDLEKGIIFGDLVTYYGGAFGDDLKQLGQEIPGVNPVTGYLVVGTDQSGYGSRKAHALSYVEGEKNHIVNTTQVFCGRSGEYAVMKMYFKSGTITTNTLTIKSK